MAKNDERVESKSKCSYTYKYKGLVIYECKRELWSKDGNHCIFHSKLFDEKKFEFAIELNKLLNSEPHPILYYGTSTDTPVFDFIGFKMTTDRITLKREFEYPVYFCNAKFSGPISFRESVFWEDANFQHSTFEDCSELDPNIFAGHPDFMDVQFKKEANFFGSVFKGKLLFSGASFFQKAAFQNVEFNEDVGFCDAVFEDESDFSYTKFHKCADFRSVIFKNRTSFKSSVIGETDFLQMQCEGLDFRKCIFRNDILFETVSSVGQINLSYSRIDGSLRVTNDILHRNPPPSILGIELKYSTVSGDISIVSTSIQQLICDHLSYYGALNILDTLNSMEASFYGVVLQRANIDNCDISNYWLKGAFLRELNCENVVIGKYDTKFICDLTGRPYDCIAEEKSVQYPGDKGRKSILRSAETVYRSMKNVCRERSNFTLSYRMRACELECKYLQAKGTDKIFLFVYRTLNGYGMRWFRVLVAMLLMITLMSVAYENIDDTINSRAEALLESLQVSFEFRFPSLDLKEEGIALGIIKFVQKIISYFLFFLFGEAIVIKVK